MYYWDEGKYYNGRVTDRLVKDPDAYPQSPWESLEVAWCVHTCMACGGYGGDASAVAGMRARRERLTFSARGRWSWQTQHVRVNCTRGVK